MYHVDIVRPHPLSDDDSVNSAAPRTRSLLTYIVLTFTLSIPFWVAGAATTFQLLPALPVSALMCVCPVGAAMILVYRANGRAGVRSLLKRSFDIKRVKVKMWYLPTILLMPCIMVVSYGVLRLMGVHLPNPELSAVPALALFAVLFIAALGEELGWSGYAIDPLQDRFGVLQCALLLGMIWAVWHVIPLLQAQRSWNFIAWWSLGTVASRIIITWLYNNTRRSVFVAALFHAMSNLSWQLFPINGSFYNPRVTGVTTAVVAVVIVIVWGPRTLVRGIGCGAAVAPAEEARR